MDFKEKGMRIALLSNVNMNFVIRMLSGKAEVYQTEGYGNELGILMNPEHSYHQFAPKITFLVMDLLEVLSHDMELASAREKIDFWFDTVEKCIHPGEIFYLSDAYLWGVETKVLADPGRKLALESLWQERLEMLLSKKSNVRIFPYRQLVESLGEEKWFSLKMWYMGKILMSNEAQKRLSEEILRCVGLELATPKKVLLLDLDNTLWGGLAGEAEHTPLLLSEDHAGLAYKNLQRVLWQMQKQGVLLGIVSKNNEEDAMEVINHHPHMVLRSECFAVKRINWEPKHENIESIAQELNLGLDSFVFWDDNPAERGLVKGMLPQVEVPDFPERAEELPQAMAEIYLRLFAKPLLTKEDLEKTKQYAENAKRQKMQNASGSFADYLKSLQMVITRVEPRQHSERLTQLLNKTNQFNLTSKRMTQIEVENALEDPCRRTYLYQVEDCFGDNGIVAAVLVNLSGVPIVEEFVMSCRVMGRNVEHAILADVEQDLYRNGYTQLRGLYLPTAKNKPVETLYEKLGYEKFVRVGEEDYSRVFPGEALSDNSMVEGTAEYEKILSDKIRGGFFAEMRREKL